MNAIKTIIRGIDKLSDLFMQGAKWFVLALILTLVYEVVMRYILSSPTLWSFDMSYMLGSIALIFGMAYTFKDKGHVNIDIFYEKLSNRNQALLNVLFALLLFFPLWLYLLYNLWPHMLRSWEIKERSPIGSWLPPFYPFKTWIFAGVALLTLQGIAEFLKDMVVLVTGGARP